MAILSNNSKATDAANWEAQLRKGCLEMAILATVAGGELYGLELLRRLETRSNLVVAEGTVYPILGRLTSEGLLSARWVEGEAGHPRKYYSLTAAGRRRAIAMARSWQDLATNLDELVSPLLDGKDKR